MKMLQCPWRIEAWAKFTVAMGVLLVLVGAALCGFGFFYHSDEYYPLVISGPPFVLSGILAVLSGVLKRKFVIGLYAVTLALALLALCVVNILGLAHAVHFFEFSCEKSTTKALCHERERTLRSLSIGLLLFGTILGSAVLTCAVLYWRAVVIGPPRVLYRKVGPNHYHKGGNLPFEEEEEEEEEGLLSGEQQARRH